MADIRTAPIHHYLFVTQEGRCYAAIDTSTRQFITDEIFMPRVPPVLVAAGEERIHLSTTVMPINQLDELDERQHLMGTYLVPSEWIPKENTKTHVNFEKDVFFFWSTHQLRCMFRFLSYRVNSINPTLFKIDHWSRKIQELGIYVPEDNLPLSRFEQSIFVELRRLRQVFLIVTWKSWPFPECRRLSGRTDILIGLDECIQLVEECELPPESIHLRVWGLGLLRRKKARAEALRTEILQLLEIGRREHAEVLLMAEGDF